MAQYYFHFKKGDRLAIDDEGQAYRISQQQFERQN